MLDRASLFLHLSIWFPLRFFVENSGEMLIQNCWNAQITRLASLRHSFWDYRTDARTWICCSARRLRGIFYTCQSDDFSCLWFSFSSLFSSLFTLHSSPVILLPSLHPFLCWCLSWSLLRCAHAFAPANVSPCVFSGIATNIWRNQVCGHKENGMGWSPFTLRPYT